jgi:hypothetical protein
MLIAGPMMSNVGFPMPRTPAMIGPPVLTPGPDPQVRTHPLVERAERFDDPDAELDSLVRVDLPLVDLLEQTARSHVAVDDALDLRHLGQHLVEHLHDDLRTERTAPPRERDDVHEQNRRGGDSDDIALFPASSLRTMTEGRCSRGAPSRACSARSRCRALICCEMSVATKQNRATPPTLIG